MPVLRMISLAPHDPSGNGYNEHIQLYPYTKTTEYQTNEEEMGAEEELLNS